MKVLVIDDESEILEIMSEYLTEEGWEVETAENGAQGWMLFSEDPDSFDAIVSDMRMPKVDGLALLKMLRQKRFEHPVIFITGQVDNMMLTEAETLTVLAILKKPFDLSYLVSLLSRIKSK